MKSEFFSMFGIPPTECEIEARKDELGVPRLWFRSTGNPLVGFDLTGATQLQHLLTDAGEANQANEIGQHIAKARGITQLLLGRLVFVFEGQFVEIGLVAVLLVSRPRAANQLSQIIAAASWIASSKFLAVVSWRGGR